MNRKSEYRLQGRAKWNPNVKTRSSRNVKWETKYNVQLKQTEKKIENYTKTIMNKEKKRKRGGEGKSGWEQ